MMIFRLAVVMVLATVCLTICTNCLTCVQKQTCTQCLTGYSLKNGQCDFESGTSSGSLTGILIGSTFGFVILVSLLLAFCAKCRKTREVIGTDQVFQDPYYTVATTTHVTPANGNLFPQSNFAYNPRPQPMFINSLPPLTRPVFMNTPPIQPMHPLKPSASYLNRDNCTICLSNGTNLRLMPCTHQFHVSCMVQWFNKRRVCPNCNDNDPKAFIMCRNCGRFNEEVTFCPVNCPNTNHMDCFMQRNQSRMVCRACQSDNIVKQRSRIVMW